MSKYGFCSKCVGGIYPSYTSIKVNKAKYGEPFKKKYCSKCGNNLITNCFRCNGTGKIFSINNYRAYDYCSDCGRALETEPPDDSCPECYGTGEIYCPFHFCR